MFAAIRLASSLVSSLVADLCCSGWSTIILILQAPKHRQETAHAEADDLRRSHTINRNEFTDFLYSCYNHFCAADFQLNTIAFLKRHSSPFALLTTLAVWLYRLQSAYLIARKQCGAQEQGDVRNQYPSHERRHAHP
jgi:hypothetical protein